MTMTTEFESDQPLERLLDKLEHRVNQVVAEVAHHAHQMRKQEIPITHSVAQALRNEFSRPLEVEGLEVRVDVEEFTPLQESRSGADLYVSLTREDKDERISKGMLVQSKRYDALKIAEERRRLRNQSARMRRRAHDASY